MHSGNGAEVIGIKKNRKLDIIILHTSPKKAELQFLEIGLSLIDEMTYLRCQQDEMQLIMLSLMGFLHDRFLLLDHAVQIDFVWNERTAKINK